MSEPLAHRTPDGKVSVSINGFHLNTEDAARSLRDQLNELLGDGPRYTDLSSQLTAMQAERDAWRKKAETANSDADMYANAWVREIGGPYANKRHHIDMCVMTTRSRMEELRVLKTLEASRAEAKAAFPDAVQAYVRTVSQDLVNRIAEACVGSETWVVMNREGTAFCLSYSRREFHDAKERCLLWLEERKRLYPENVEENGWQVVRQQRYSVAERLAREAAGLECPND